MPAKKPAGKSAKPGAKGGGGAIAKKVAEMKARREAELAAEQAAKEAEEEAERTAKEDAERREQEEKDKLERRRLAKEEKSAAIASGKAVSKEEQKKIDANRKKIEQMRAAGMVIPEALLQKLEGGGGGDEPKPDGKAAKKKAAIATKMKKKPQAKDDAPKEEKKVAEVKEESDEDGWEAEGDDALAEQEKAAAAAAAAAERKEKEAEEGGDDVADDWENEGDDDEEEKPKQAPKEAPKAKKHADPVMVPAKKQGKAGKEKDAPVVDPDAVRDLRSPICTVLGHVDTGKTKLLDCIRRTNVQSGEAGGITQQIGASFFPIANIMEKTKELVEKRQSSMKMEVPGLLVIDTPGHESFENLRSRGSSLCDISILVVDIMHGLEPQTLSSIKLLREKKCPFVVALNKIDRLYEWAPKKDKDFTTSFGLQKDHVQHEFQQRLEQMKIAFAEQGLNADLYTNVLKQGKASTYVNLVPTSAHTGEGIADLLLLLVHLTQKFMGKKVAYNENVQCTCLELKMIEGLGLTIDVILVNGMLREGDTIVVCGLNGPIVTQIRALLTPQPMKEIRVKSEYVHHKEIKAAMGIKIAANDLEGAIPGTPVLVAKGGEDLEELKEEVMRDVSGIIKKTQSDKGVTVQSSTLGALEALLSFLKDCNIPVASVGVGPIHKKDVLRAVGVKERHPKFGVILAFDVPISEDGQRMADQHGIKVFTANIIYHLEDKFKAYLEEYTAKLAEKNKDIAVFPCHLKLHEGSVFNKKNPIVLGLDVVQGQLRPGCPLFTMKAPEEGKRAVPFHVGKVLSVELDHKELKVHRGPKPVAVKIQAKEETMTFGRQIDEGDEYWSEISRDSIDALKDSFRSEMKDEDWRLVLELKKRLQIM